MKFLYSLVFIFGFVATAHAWQPTKTVEVVIPFPPGSGNDKVARPLIESIEKQTGVKFNIVNKAGAGGTVGSTYFSKLPSDGHYLNVISVGGIAAMDYTFPAFHVAVPPYKVNSFEYVTSLAYSPIVVIANKDDTVNNPKELVDVLLKDRVTVADSGGAGRLGLESILVNMDIRKKNPQVIRIEHKGPAESVTDVMGGHVRFATVPLAVAYQHHKAGKLKIVALTTKDKTPGFPVEGFSAINQNIDVGLVWGIAMPQGTSKEAQEYWVNAFNNAKKDPRVIENFEVNMISFENKYNTPSKFTQYVNEQYKNNSKVVDYIVNSTK